jgi:lipopolysaccharide/colanic/teichoic acid biosynthesis glycosyltransferase
MSGGTSMRGGSSAAVRRKRAEAARTAVGGRLHTAAGARESTPKRVLDVVVATILLVLLAPVFVLVSLLVAADSRGPLLYACERIGRSGRRIRVWKFRKMRDGACGPALTLEGDERFTRVGPWLAATKLDELPQLWNVLRGDMSLVGPRPEDAAFVGLRREEYAQILGVKPGITGLSQLAFTREREILAGDGAIDRYVERILPQKIRMDRLYARRRTFGLDLRILVWTAVAVVLRRELAVDRLTGRVGLRHGSRRRLPRAVETDRRAR